MKEIWKDIQGWEGYYQVSNHGRVKSFDRIVHRLSRYGNPQIMRCKGRILKPSLGSLGYWTVGLQKDRNGIKTTYIHRLIGKAFVSNPNNKPQINHINGIKSDNSIPNLEWTTQSENVIHAHNIGLTNHDFHRGEKSHKAKLTEPDIRVIRQDISNGIAMTVIAKIYGVNPKTIFAIKHGQTWVHVS